MKNDLSKKLKEYKKRHIPASGSYVTNFGIDRYMEDQSVETVKEPEEGFLGKIKSFFTVGPEFWLNVPNALRMLAEKRAEGFSKEKQLQLAEINNEKDGLDLVKEYIDLVDKLKDLNYQSDLDSIQNRLTQLDSFFKSEAGLKNPAIRALMYDIDGDLTVGQKAKVALNYLDRGNNPDEFVKYNKDEGFLGGLKRELNNLVTGFEQSLSSIGNAFVGIGNLASKGLSEIGIPTGYDSGYITYKALEQAAATGYKQDGTLDVSSVGGSLINELYLGDKIWRNNKKQQWLDNWKQENDRKSKQYSAELDKYQEDIRNGNLKIPFTEGAIDIYKWIVPSKKYEPNTGVTIDNAWDPDDLSDEWRRKQEKMNGSLLHPVYMIPEVGSTLGMVEGMIESIGLNAASEAVIRKLPSVLLGNKWKQAYNAAIVTKDINALRTLNEAKIALDTSKKLGITTAAIRSAELTTSANIIANQRRMETAQETMDAYAARVMNDSYTNGADLQSVFGSIKTYLEERGIDTSKFSPQDFISEAIARNIETGDKVFDNQVKESKQGLDKLINSNNALAVTDYLETLGFMSYGEKILSRFANVRIGELLPNFNKVSRYDAEGNLLKNRRGVSQVWQDMKTNRDFAAKQRIMRERGRELSNGQYITNMYDNMLAAYDGKITGIAQSLINHNHFLAGLATSRIQKYLASKLKMTAPTMIIEGAEEGVQTTLQQKYEAGEYDNYKVPALEFNINDVLQLPNLYGYVLDAMHGAHGSSDEEIVKSVIIGAFVGSLFPVALNSVTNLSSNPNNQNLRNLITSLKNDATMTGLVGHQFDTIADEKKIRLYTEAFHRTGVNAERLMKSYADLLNSVDEKNGLIDKQMVSRDMDLLEATWYSYTNKKILDELKNKGIKKYSKEHKDIILDGAKKIADPVQTKRDLGNTDSQLYQYVLKNSNLIEKVLDENTSDEEKQQIYQENPALKTNVEKISKVYQDYVKSIQQENEENKTKYESDIKQKGAEYRAMTIEQLLDHEVRERKVVYEWIKKYLTDTGEIVNTQGSDAFVRRRGIELLNQMPSFRKNAENELLNAIQRPEEVEPKSLQDYIKGVYSSLFSFFERISAENAEKLFATDESILETIQQLTGFDIDTSEIKGLRDGLQQFIGKLLKEEEDSSINDELRKINKIREQSGLDPIPLNNYGDFFKGDYALQLDEQDEIARLLKNKALYEALQFAQVRAAAPYINQEQMLPYDIELGIYGKDAKTTPIRDLVEAYKRKQLEDQQVALLDQRQGDAVLQEDLRQIRKDADWEIILSNMRNRGKERERIVHKKAKELEQQQETPVEETSVEENQSVSVESPAEEQPQNQQPQEQPPTVDRQQLMSDAERQAQRVGELTEGEDPNEEKRKQRALDRAKKRKQSLSQEKTQPEQEQQTDPPAPITPNIPERTKKEPFIDNDDEPINEDVKNQIQLFNDGERSKITPVFSVENKKPVVVRLEQIITLDDGMVIGRVEEDGKEYYYIAHVQKTDDHTKTYTGSAYNENGQKVNKPDILIQYKDEPAQDGDTKAVVIFAERSNIPITVNIVDADGNIIKTYDNPGVEIISSDDTVGENDSLEEPVSDEEDDEQSSVDEKEKEEEISDFEKQKIADKLGDEEIELYEQMQQQADDTDVSAGEISTYGEDILIGGLPLGKELQQLFMDEMDLLFDIEYMLEDYSGKVNTAKDKTDSQIKDDAYDFVSDVFFYRPDANTPMKLRVGGKDIHLKYKIATGKQLADRLIQKGWVNKAFSEGRIYYVVTQAQDAAYDNTRQVEQDADTFTVSIIIEDPEKNCCYAMSLRQLGKYKSLGYEKDPITGDIRMGLDGKPITREYYVNRELELREKLGRIHTRYPIGLDRKTAYDRERLNVAEDYYNSLYGGRPYTPSENAPEEEKEQYLDELSKFRKRVENWLDPNFKYSKNDPKFEEKTKQRLETISLINQKARFRLRQPGKNPLTDKQIDDAIDNLRKVRMEIINAYLKKDESTGKYIFPEEPRTDVKPDYVEVSDGRYNTQRTPADTPELKRVNRKNNPFGASEDISGLNSQILDGRIKLGVGSGALRTNNPFAISDFREGNESQIWKGRGLAGKIFIMVKSNSGQLKPVMLSEQKFNLQHSDSEIPSIIGSESDKLQLCIDPFTGNIASDTNVRPSAAEVLLYLMFGKLNKSLLPANLEGLQQQLAQFFVHYGDDTLLADSNAEARLPYYAAKQLAIINGNLVIGIKRGKSYYKQYIAASSIFDNTPAAIENRKMIVRAIASQMHWNTEKITMNQRFGEDTTNIISQALEQWFNNNSDQEQFVLANVPEFNFSKRDLFEIGSDGKVERIKRNMTMAAWLIHTGRLMSDIGETIFKDPFVFASGIKESAINDVINQGQEADAVLPGNNVDLTRTEANNVISSSDKIKQAAKIALGTPSSPFVKNIFHSEQEYIDALINQSISTNSEFTQKYGPTVRVIALNIDTTSFKNPEDLKKEVQNKVNDFVKTIDPKIVGADSKLFVDDFTFNTITDLQYKTLIRQKKSLIVLHINQHGHVFVGMNHYVGPALRPQAGSTNILNGVYETRKTGGTFDEQSARKWLCDKLGIQQHQVLVINAALKGTEDKDVFGLTNISLDVVLNEITGNMVFSNLAGYGVHYHEAWHYVNLLLHSPAQQIKLWDEYAEYHPELKGKTYREIEEAMAEEFRQKAENAQFGGISYKIRQFFGRVLEFLKISKRKPQYQQVFDAIHKGKYKNTKHLNNSAIREFKKKYPKGVQMLHVTGIRDEVTQKMYPSISSPREFYQVSDAILDYIFTNVSIKKPQDALSLSGENFKDVLQMLKSYSQQLDPTLKEMVMAFYNNPEALQRRLFERFLSLGIITRIKKDETATQKEDQPDNIWDRFQFSISKKDNVTFRAKLFLSQIPRAQLVFDEVTGKKYPIIINNPLFVDTPQYELFDVAYNQIMGYTNNCVGYGVADENGEFPEKSFRGKVRKAAGASGFFAQLDQMLDDIEDDFELKTQIYATVNSQKPNVMFHELAAARSISFFDPDEIDRYSEEEISDIINQSRQYNQADRNKQWVFRHSNALRASRNIPSRWSNSFALSGVVDQMSDKLVIKKSYTDAAVQLKLNIKNLYNNLSDKKNKGRSEDFFVNGYYDILNATVELCNHLGIIMDTDVLDYFVNLRSQSESYLEKAKIIHDSFTKQASGTIGYYVSLIASNVGQSQIVYKIGKQSEDNKYKSPKELNKLFTGSKTKSDIIYLALAMHAIHPNSDEFSVRGPNGEMHYPTSQNNFLSAKVRNINITEGQHAIDMMKSPYARHSIILRTARDFENGMPDDQMFTLNLEIGLKSSLEQKGADYFGITPMEDYIQKMLELDQDPDFIPYKKLKDKDYNSGEFTHISSPTMADKKTHYTISSKNPNFKTSHEPIRGIFSRTLANDKAIQNWINYSSNYTVNIEDLTDEELFTYIDEYYRFHPDKAFRRFSDNTLLRFCNYFLDELETLIQYYDKANVAEIVKDKNKRISNYHGKVKGGMMDFSGNGGKFRYFYDVLNAITGSDVNLNQKLEWLYNLEHDVLQKVKISPDNVDEESLKQFISLQDIDPSITSSFIISAITGENNAGVSKLFDGFELIRAELNKIKDTYFREGVPTEELKTAMNKKLFNMVDTEMYKVCTDPSINLGFYSESQHMFYPTAVPTQLLSRQNERFLVNKIPGGSSTYIPYGKGSQWRDGVMFYSLIANHTINSMTSVIEFEKVFSADPAFYKWKTLPGKQEKESRTISYILPSGVKVTKEYFLQNIGDNYSDKIKRLGSILSPGAEMRLDLSLGERENEDYNSDGKLNSYHYSLLIVDDVEVSSRILDPIIRPRFKNSLIAEYLRVNDIPAINEYIKSRGKGFTLENLIDEVTVGKSIKGSEFNKKAVDAELESYGVDPLYIQDSALAEEYATKNSIADYVYNLLPRNLQEEIDLTLSSQVNPYENINVADAQIFVRPAMYRKIRMSLGQWTTEADETGYSDEIAYNILETDPDWQRDPVKARIVSRLELFPLKMSYVSNEPVSIRNGYNLNMGALDKACYFPLFKYTASAQTGRQLYDRMNKPGNEIDMIAFVSAVKVGAPQQLPKLYTDKSQQDLGQINPDILNKDNSHSVSYDILSDTGQDVNVNLNPETLPIVIQDLHYLRFQLNTESHESSERDLGTQAGKLAYSNIFDDGEYGKSKRKGYNIKKDIMALINALSIKGQQKLARTYYKHNTQDRVVDQERVHKWFSEITRSNGLGANAEEIMQSGVAESLTSRKLFEQSVSAKVNDEVVDINMNGGTAVQQSVIGFVDYGSRNAISNEDLKNRNDKLKMKIEEIFDLSKKDLKKINDRGIYTVEQFLNSGLGILKSKQVKDEMEFQGLHVGDKIVDYIRYNNGKELKWHSKNNSMQVLLSINFFRDVIPDEYKTTFETARKWLLLNNIIGENSDPYGMGYRIPTQGMSSIFAFQVADVLPEASGDLIVVPREFTAQTGSDFDVDKLYLATFSYYKENPMRLAKNKALINWIKYSSDYTVTDPYDLSYDELFKYIVEYYRYHPDEVDNEIFVEDENGDFYTRSKRFSLKHPDDIKEQLPRAKLQKLYLNENRESIQNKLLQDFIDVITDNKNYAEARASIDVITKKINKDLLSWLKPVQYNYTVGMSTLLPSFQLNKKEEFKVGKDGIAPFALNTANVPLVQAVHLSFDYTGVIAEYGFGHLDDVNGEDHQRKSAWLSAMINAHVDVAKDPYVFTLNVNSATYNYANFLLRAGKGISTFTFLTQPILVEYATKINSSGGVYGQNLDGNNTQNISVTQRKNTIKKDLIITYINYIKSLREQISQDFWKNNSELSLNIKEQLAYFEAKVGISKEKDPKKIPALKINRKLIFDYNFAKSQILALRNSGNKLEQLKACIYQLHVMQAFGEIEKYAEGLSDLIQCSRIDTKKFGNNTASHLNFAAKLTQFMYKSNAPWIIRGASESENRYPQLALAKYFEETFLKQKFEAAVKYTRDIVGSELLVGSDEFVNIFNIIAGETNGTFAYKKPLYKRNKNGTFSPIFVKNKQNVDVLQETDELVSFKPMSDESVQVLSGAINNIMRFNILINLGQKALSEGNSQFLPATGDNVQSDDYLNDGPIDFIYGGSFNNIVVNVAKLIYGDENVPSLPVRIQNFIKEVLENPDSEMAVDIVEDGKIINEFLLYLNPVAKTKQFPLDRLMLNESAIRTSKERKQILSSYWNELLTHPNSDVRKLARDIAIYSYYMTYDTNVINNIMDILPPYFRRQYDTALEMAVRQRGVKLKDCISNLFGLGNINIIETDYDAAAMLYDVIARNYWYDDNIVHRVYEHGTGVIGNGRNIEYRGKYHTDRFGNRFPGIVITSNYNGDPLYVKIRKGNNTVLYRRIGVVSKLDNKGKNQINPAYIYVSVQKAGFHYDNKHMFEFFKTMFIPSMFKDNMLPSVYRYEDLIQHLDDLLSNLTSQGKYKWVYTLNDQLQIPDDITKDYNKYVYDTAKETVASRKRSFFNGAVNVVASAKPQEMLYNISGLLIIKIDNNESSGTVKFPNRTVHINLSKGNVQEQLMSEIKRLGLDPKAGRPIYMDMVENSFELTEEEKEMYIEMGVNMMAQQYAQSNPQITPEQLQNYINDIRLNEVDNLLMFAKPYKMSAIANLLVQTLLFNNYHLTRAYGIGMNSATRAIMQAFVHNIEDFTASVSNIYVSKEDLLSDAYEIESNNMEIMLSQQDFYESEQEQSKNVDDLKQEEENRTEEFETQIEGEEDPFDGIEDAEDDEFEEDETGNEPTQSDEDEDPFADIEDAEIEDDDIMDQYQKEQENSSDEKKPINEC